MSDPLPTEVFLNDEGETFYTERSLHEVNRESIPERRDLCFTDPQRLEKVVHLQKANEVAQQEQPGAEVLVFSFSSTAQALEFFRDSGAKTGRERPLPSEPTVEKGRSSSFPHNRLGSGNWVNGSFYAPCEERRVKVILQTPVNQQLVYNSSGGNVESLGCETVPSADASSIGNEELGLIREEAASAADTSVRGRKKFKHQLTEPFDDPRKEKKRLNAKKQYDIRVKRKREQQALKRKLEQTEEELTNIKKSHEDTVRENEILKELLRVALDAGPIQVCFTGNQETPQN